MLEAVGIETFYGASQALFGVDIAVRPGETLALMGRNGMGKTTLIRTICGLSPARRGAVRFCNRDVTHWPAHRIARAGIGLSPEGRRCFPTLTVRENLLAAARPGRWDLAAVGALFPRLAERAGQKARTLSGGEQQMLAIGRALTTNPRLLILDEATEGLAPVIRAEIWAALRAIRAEGLSAIIVDKHLADLTPLADRALVLERGREAWSGPAADLDRATAQRLLGV